MFFPGGGHLGVGDPGLGAEAQEGDGSLAMCFYLALCKCSHPALLENLGAGRWEAFSPGGMSLPTDLQFLFSRYPKCPSRLSECSLRKCAV